VKEWFQTIERKSEAGLESGEAVPMNGRNLLSKEEGH
jgi:hypothetical protein